MSEAKTTGFPPGTFVWAKYGEWPWWPGQVIDPPQTEDMTEKEGKCVVYFYNDGDRIAYISERKLRVYNPDLKKDFIVRKSHELHKNVRKAVELLEDDFDKGTATLLTLDPSFPTTEETADNTKTTDGRTYSENKRRKRKRAAEERGESPESRYEEEREGKRKRRKQESSSHDTSDRHDYEDTRGKRRTRRSADGNAPPRSNERDSTRKEESHRMAESCGESDKRSREEERRKRHRERERKKSVVHRTADDVALPRKKIKYSPSGSLEDGRVGKKASSQSHKGIKVTRSGSKSTRRVDEHEVTIPRVGKAERGKDKEDSHSKKARHSGQQDNVTCAESGRNLPRASSPTMPSVAEAANVMKIKKLEERIKELEAQNAAHQALTEFARPPPINPLSPPQGHIPTDITLFSFEPTSKKASKEALRDLTNRIEESSKKLAHADIEQQHKIKSVKELREKAEELRALTQEKIDDLLRSYDRHKKIYQDCQTKLNKEEETLAAIPGMVKDALASFERHPDVIQLNQEFVALDHLNQHVEQCELEIVQDLSSMAQLDLDPDLLKREKPTRALFSLLNNSKNEDKGLDIFPSEPARRAARKVFRNWMMLYKKGGRNPSNPLRRETNESDYEVDRAALQGEAPFYANSKETTGKTERSPRSSASKSTKPKSSSSPKGPNNLGNQRVRNVKRPDMIQALTAFLTPQKRGNLTSEADKIKAGEIAVALDEYLWQAVHGDKEEYYNASLRMAKDLRKSSGVRVKLLGGAVLPQEYASTFVGDSKSANVSPAEIDQRR